jgi:extradiol dioxygenase family protein
MALTGVLRPGHVAIRVLELEPALKHYTEVLGLIETGRDKKKRVYLKAWDEHDHHSVVLREADEAGMDYMGWKVDSPAISRNRVCAPTWSGSRRASTRRPASVFASRSRPVT